MSLVFDYDVEIEDNTADFERLSANKLDNALSNMGDDIETIAKVKKVPVKHGHLASEIRHKRRGEMKHIVEVNKEYAAFQEFGGDRKRKVKNYSKPGTGPHYLRDSGELISRNAKKYIKSQTRLIRYVKGV